MFGSPPVSTYWLGRVGACRPIPSATESATFGVIRPIIKSMSRTLTALKLHRSGAQLLLAALEREGVDVIFGYPGGAIMPVYDALYDSPIRHILARHEQGAGFAAMGYARATGKVGVALATSGPGATNLVTCLADAYLDSVPLVAITGQVASQLMGTDAFQEVDIFGVTLPVVKHSFIVRRVEDLAATVARAFDLARSGRPGPVLIDLPKDVALQTLREPDTALAAAPAPAELPRPAAEQLQAAAALLSTAQRPILYVGGGALAEQATEAVRHFVDVCGIPTVATLKGLGTLPTDHTRFLGMLGMHGSQAANLAVQACDLLICAGARFDDRATGDLRTFAPHAQVIHLDADPAEVSKLRPAQVALVGDLAAALRALAAPLRIDAWRARCAEQPRHLAWKPSTGAGICAEQLIAELTSQSPAHAFFTTDIGQHQMWVAQRARLRRPEQLITSGGLGTMGYGLPAAVGAQMGQPQALVINFTGDGSFMMNVQELATLKRYALPVKIVLFDNQVLGMVRQWQGLFFEQRYSETDLWDNPDFVALVRAFGIPGLCIARAHEVPAAITGLLAAPGPFLLHVRIDRAASVWPLVPPGKSNSQMLSGAELAPAADSGAEP